MNDLSGVTGTDKYSRARDNMVADQIAARGVTDAAVLQAMRSVPRHHFVRSEDRHRAYGDFPLAIGHDQTISQPFIVATMSEALALKADDRVLEVGTGSGYQAAVLATIVVQVYTIEIFKPLAERAESTLVSLAIRNVEVRTGDGYRGWPEAAPFDAIILTAAPDHVPQPLVDQLREGGRMVLPLGADVQKLIILTKHAGEIVRDTRFGVRFVPMTGEAEQIA